MSKDLVKRLRELKSQVMRLELELVGYRTRNKQLEAALREIAALGFRDGDSAMSIASKALENFNG